MVFLYEFIGTFGLLMAINTTNGNAYGVSLVFFLLLKMAMPVSGAHFNPAVTLGVYINMFKTNTWLKNFIQLISMWGAQILGGWVSMEIMYAILEDESNPEIFPYLKQSTPHSWQATFFELISTFCFVMANLMVKDEVAKEYTAGDSHWLSAASVAISLCAMHLVAGEWTSASINPAVSISQYILMKSRLNKDIGDAFWTVYMLGPLLGGLFAGLFSWAHSYLILNYNFDDVKPEDAEAESEPAKKEQ